MICSICSSSAVPVGSAKILGRYPAVYYRCGNCGFIRTEEPYWLDEAYATAAITGSDVGLVLRNIALAAISKVVIAVFFGKSGTFVDYAGGYGLLVRIMRDSGFDFRWYDKYCDNLFARGFPAPLPGSREVRLVTAFEVMEHLVDPWQELEQMLSYSRNILFTTELLPTPAPQPDKWWYYGLEHGQHVSFYSRESLLFLAKRAGLNYYTNGSTMHLFTEQRISRTLFSAIARYKIARMLAPLAGNGSFIAADYAAVSGTVPIREDD